MLLAIDVGNSHTVCGIFKKNQIVNHWRFKTDRRKTSDDLAVSFYTMLSLKGMTFNDISGVIIASVVPTQQKAWIGFIEEIGWSSLEVTKALVANDIKILIDHPEEVGADRIVNAVAGFNRFATALIIVDFGTAITFDCVSAAGDYIGGAIAPGVAISLDALAAQTAKLPRVDLSKAPSSSIGKNTTDAIRSGILYGYGGMVDGLVKHLQEGFEDISPKVIATGGMADLIIPYTTTVETYDPMLTLVGLQILYERNS